MSAFMALVSPFFTPSAPRSVGVANPAIDFKLESAAFTHALVALAAKLAAVDGTVNQAEYAAFHALFVEGDEAQRRSQFVKHLTDSSGALQYARQIAAMTQDAKLHADLFDRLVKIAVADGALNAAEMEMLRAIADCLGIAREAFRARIGQTMTATKTSPYAVLGISSRVDDVRLREHYMARVQRLHPDRYQAAGASQETIAMLSDQLAEVNAAYQAVMRERAKKHASPFGGWKRKNNEGVRG